MATILLVEDEAAVRWVLAEALARRGHRCWEAQDGREALDLVRSGMPDLVLSDVRMPRLDGAALARHLLAPGRPWVPLLFLTSLGDEETGDLAQEVGAWGCLRKPCREADLVRAVEEALRAEPPGTPPPEPPSEEPAGPSSEVPEPGQEPDPAPGEEAAPPCGSLPPDPEAGAAPRRGGWRALLRAALPGSRKRS